jgi:hypothetical protein
MAVQSVNIKSQESGISDGKLTATRVYVVEVQAGDNSETARLAPGLPSYGDSFPGASAMKVKSIQAASHQDDLTTYLVTVEYSESSGGTSTQASGTNPLEAPPTYSYGGSAVTEPVFFDTSPQPGDWDEEAQGEWQGKPIVNSADELFDEQPQRERVLGTLTITRNETDYNDLGAEAYKGTVSAAPVTIRGITYVPGTLRMGNITADGPHEATYTTEAGSVVTVSYWRVTYELQKNIRGWKLSLEDRGRHELVENSTTPGTFAQRKIVLPDGTLPIHPYPLDGEGHAKEQAHEPPAILQFQIDPLVDWTPLALE